MLQHAILALLTIKRVQQDKRIGYLARSTSAYGAAVGGGDTQWTWGASNHATTVTDPPKSHRARCGKVLLSRGHLILLLEQDTGVESGLCHAAGPKAV